MDKELITKNLTLSYTQESDLEDVHELHSIPEVDQYNTLGIPTNIHVTSVYLDEWIENRKRRTQFVFSIRLKSTDQFIGLMAITKSHYKYQKGEVWYKLHPSFWGNGYATEALKRLVEFGFETLNLHRIEAGCAVENIGSIKVLEKVGMIREGRRRENLPLKSGWSDNYDYGILRDEF
ncbi:GNAT family N-acetyltransferase [Aquimarina pacifica]|uniref:GNAT family N-acetyltransferase n=1 Tax=Aquimarina pacifica TaxID=1296415 RepID=UPI00046F3960|nr:GNAT family protein [Aquimarina pacifica]